MLRPILIRFAIVVALLTSGSFAQAAPKVPTTVEEHVALAKQYQEKAANYRAEAKTHRDMAAAYKKSALNAHSVAQGEKNPSVEKAIAHCDAIASAAEKLATENEKAADYHTLRGKELQGK